MKQSLLIPVLAGVLLTACKKTDLPSVIQEDAASFTEISSTTIGKTGAAEITAYDPLTKKLFVLTSPLGHPKLEVK